MTHEETIKRLDTEELAIILNFPIKCRVFCNEYNEGCELSCSNMKRINKTIKWLKEDNK